MIELYRDVTIQRLRLSLPDFARKKYDVPYDVPFSVRAVVSVRFRQREITGDAVEDVVNIGRAAVGSRRLVRVALVGVGSRFAVAVVIRVDDRERAGVGSPTPLPSSLSTAKNP